MGLTPCCSVHDVEVVEVVLALARGDAQVVVHRAVHAQPLDADLGRAAGHVLLPVRAQPEHRVAGAEAALPCAPSQSPPAISHQRGPQTAAAGVSAVSGGRGRGSSAGRRGARTVVGKGRGSRGEVELSGDRGRGRGRTGQESHQRGDHLVLGPSDGSDAHGRTACPLGHENFPSICDLGEGVAQHAVACPRREVGPLLTPTFGTWRVQKGAALPPL
eukprot:COSAG04_NODE_390_length_15167_cov_93.727900_10_plen_217_part_00